MIAKIVYKADLSRFQLNYIKHCVGLMTKELNKHISGIDSETPTTAREGKIINSMTSSYISAAIKLALLSTELEDYRKGDLP
jgi:hypothetical protein